MSAKFAGRQVTGSFFILFLLLGGSLGSPHKKQFSHNTFPKIMIGCGHILTCSSMWYDIIAWDSSNFMSLLGVHALCSLSQAIELLFLFNMMLNFMTVFQDTGLSEIENFWENHNNCNFLGGIHMTNTM